MKFHPNAIIISALEIFAGQTHGRTQEAIVILSLGEINNEVVKSSIFRLTVFACENFQPQHSCQHSFLLELSFSMLFFCTWRAILCTFKATSWLLYTLHQKTTDCKESKGPLCGPLGNNDGSKGTTLRSPGTERVKDGVP